MIQQIIAQQGISFNAQQSHAMEHYRGPAIVLAVAGAGKTTVMCARIAHLMLHHQVPPKKIRNLTFSRAAAADMQKRFISLFGELENSHQVVFSTIHSLAHGVVRSFYRQQGISFQLIENRKHKLYKPRLLRAIFQQVNRSHPSDDEMEEMLQKISLAKNRMMTTAAIDSLTTSVKGFQSIYQRYESYKKANGWLDYDDLLTETHRILVTHEEWMERYRRQYQFWQVDEFQDTSLLQWQIIQLLASPANDLFCVGDDDQMIYSFRGSTPDLLLNFSRELPDAATCFMEENHRCSRNVTHLSNQIIHLNKQRYSKKAFTSNTHETFINIKKVEDSFKQTQAVVEQIQSMMAKKTCSIGLLYRNNLSAIPLADALHQMKIGFHVRDLKMNFINHWLTQDLLQIIDFAYHPDNVKLFEQIYYKVNGYISKVMIQWLKEHPPLKGQSVLLHLKDSGLMTEVYQKKAVRDLMHQFDALTRKRQVQIIYHLVDHLGYGLYLERKKMISQEMADQLLEVIAFLCRDVTEAQGLREKLESMRPSAVEHHSPVTLTTIHSSKGLEFDHVILVDVSEGLFPAQASIKAVNGKQDLLQMEEERRLLYVAMTRTRNSLTLYAPENGFRKRKNESRFISEIRQLQEPGVLSTGWGAFLSHLDAGNLDDNPAGFSVKPGDAVLHRSFGPGQVTEVNQKSVAIRFSDGIRKIACDFIREVLTIHTD